MSTAAFNPRQGPVVVEAEVTGPNRTNFLKLAVDTGATTTVIDLADLVILGFDPAQPYGRTHLTTGSMQGVVPLFALTRLGALGQNRFFLPVVGYSVSLGHGIHGLLGLDFLRDQVLTIDFRQGQITLA